MGKCFIELSLKLRGESERNSGNVRKMKGGEGGEGVTKSPPSLRLKGLQSDILAHFLSFLTFNLTFPSERSEDQRLFPDLRIVNCT